MCFKERNGFRSERGLMKLYLLMVFYGIRLEENVFGKILLCFWCIKYRYLMLFRVKLRSIFRIKGYCGVISKVCLVGE